jgi:hypothetical protein
MKITVRNSFQYNIKNGKIANAQKDQCEGQITEEELFQAIKSFQSGETPGIDGIEVYQAFFDILKAPLLNGTQTGCVRGRKCILSPHTKRDNDTQFKISKQTLNQLHYFGDRSKSINFTRVGGSI